MKEVCACGKHRIETNGAQYMAHGRVCCSRICYSEALHAAAPEIERDGFMWGGDDVERRAV